MDSLTFDKEFLAAIHYLFEEQSPFHKTLGIRITSISYDRVQLFFKMRDEFIGNSIQGTLHGGIISTLIDVTGALAAFMGLQGKLPDESLEKRLSRIEKLGTIDLRVDYLRPGRGREFTSTGYTLKTGNKVAVSRIDLHNDLNELIAVGTGSYNIA
jgi:uncharacterized protein (TIGR00369 family)